MKRLSSGFTLIEVLVAMAIFAVLFVIVANMVNNMNTSSRVVGSRSQLTQDGQNIQRLLAGRVSEAIHVFPGGTSFTLTRTGFTTKNNTKGDAPESYDWVVNKDPFIAMILPPEAPTYIPGTNVPNNCSSSVQLGCYRFYAYYATLRGPLSNVGVNDPSRRSTVPAKDASNDDKWVIMQYKANLIGWRPQYKTPSEGVSLESLKQLTDNPGLYQGKSGDVLADFIQPQKTDGSDTDLFVASTPPNPAIDDCLLFCVIKTPSTTPRVNDGIVDIRFRMQQDDSRFSQPTIVNGTDPKEDTVTGTPTTGSATDAPKPYIGGVVSPRNWWIR